MNFRPNIPEYHNVSYIQTDSPSVSSSVSSPTIAALNIPQATWSVYRPTFQLSSTTHPIHAHLPPSPSYMGYQPSPTSSTFYSPTSQSSDYYHPPSATLSHILNNTSTPTISNGSVNNANTTTTTTTNININNNSAFYANSHSIYTYQPPRYYNINDRKNQYIIEPPLIPIPTQSRSLPLPVQLQQHQRQPQQQYHQQQVQFQMQMQNQTYYTPSIVGSPQTQRVKQRLLSLKNNIKKRKHETQIKKEEEEDEEQKVFGKRLKRQRSASTSAATTTGTIASVIASISIASDITTTTGTNVISATPESSTNLKNKRLKKLNKKTKSTTTVATGAASKSPNVTPVSSPPPSDLTFQDDDTNVVVQLENELSFLNDECATILMMLDSLRNAYLADGPNQSLAPSPGSMATVTVEGGDQMLVHDPTAFSTPIIEENRRSNDIAQNRDIEREMRIAYDDLMLQVRQVERKIARLEKKSQMITTQRSTQLNVTKENNKDKLHGKKKRK